MHAGQEVYRGVVGSMLDGDGGLWSYIERGTVTGITVDGHDMVRFGDLLMPSTEFCVTPTEAKQQIVDRIVRIIGTLQAKADRLRDEILHEQLTREEAA